MRKIKRKYTQADLFGNDKTITIRSDPYKYSDYEQGARDMIIALLRSKNSKRVHMPRRCMAMLIKAINKNNKLIKEL